MNRKILFRSYHFVFLKEHLHTLKISFLSFVVIALLLLYSKASMAQCGLPDLTGVPANIELLESYVKTTDYKVAMASDIPTESYSVLDWARLEALTLIEQYYHCQTAEGNSITATSVLNPSEYFNEYVVPYSHIIVDEVEIRIFQDELLLSSSPRRAINTGEQTDTIKDIAYTETFLGDGLIQMDYGELVLIIDTVQQFEIYNRLDSNGQIESVRFIQNDPADLLRSVPLFAVEYVKNAKPNGDCYFDIVEEYYSYYCRTDTALGDTVAIRSSKNNGYKVSDKFNVYPNPAQTYIQLEYMPFNETESSSAKLQIIDQSGKLIYQQNGVYGNEMHVDIGQYPNGLYIIRMIAGDTILVNKFIKL